MQSFESTYTTSKYPIELVPWLAEGVRTGSTPAAYSIDDCENLKCHWAADAGRGRESCTGGPSCGSPAAAPDPAADCGGESGSGSLPARLLLLMLLLLLRLLLLLLGKRESVPGVSSPARLLLLLLLLLLQLLEI